MNPQGLLFTQMMRVAAAASLAALLARFEIDLVASSNAFVPGHRIRVEISSSNFPRFDRNPGTNEPFGLAVQLLPSEQTVYHDLQHPSVLILPVTSQ